MRCESARAKLGAYHDGELEPADRAAVADHLRDCPACGEVHADFVRLGQALRAGGRPALPVGLADKVRRSIEATAAADDVDAASKPALGGVQPAQRRPIAFMARAAVLVAACLLSAAAAWWLTSRAADVDRVEREVVNAHVRSLLQESPVQIASSEQHTVKPWFTGRTDFAPAVKDLAGNGFPLVGGRLDFVDGRRASALVYKRRLHTINVFMWPADGSGDRDPRVSMRSGYNVVAMRRSGVSVWIVSDLNSDELQLLARNL